MRIEVDRTLCEANGRCVTLAPDVFSLDDDEQLHITPPARRRRPGRSREGRRRPARGAALWSDASRSSYRDSALKRNKNRF